MRRYETICIIRPGLSEEDTTSIIDKTVQIIEQFDGSIVTVDNWGLKKLAYSIQKEQQGFYVYIEYAGKPEAVDEMERIFKIDDRVLKFMTIKTQEVYTPDAPKEETEEAAEEAAAPVEEAVAPAEEAAAPAEEAVAPAEEAAAPAEEAAAPAEEAAAPAEEAVAPAEEAAAPAEEEQSETPK